MEPLTNLQLSGACYGDPKRSLAGNDGLLQERPGRRRIKIPFCPHNPSKIFSSTYFFPAPILERVFLGLFEDKTLFFCNSWDRSPARVIPVTVPQDTANNVNEDLKIPFLFIFRNHYQATGKRSSYQKANYRSLM